MKKLISALLIMSIVSLFALAFAHDSGFKYVGVKKCKMCHKKKKGGDQYGLWMARGHAKAFATLATAESKEIAKKAGITGDPQQAKECLVCHVTAYNEPADHKMKTLTMEEGVSCEACHGPGSTYKKAKIMKALFKGTQKGAEVGLIPPAKEVCVTCHNPKSPTYKKFIYEEAVKKIAHPVPAK